MQHESHDQKKHIPWDRGNLVGQKPPLKLKEIWAIRIRLQIANNLRELALFNLAICFLQYRHSDELAGLLETAKSCRLIWN